MQSVAITGMGIICAIGNNQHQVLDSLLNCRSGLRPIRYLQTKHTQYPVGEVQLSNVELQKLCNVHTPVSRATLLSILAVEEAIRQANLSKRQLPQTTFVSATCVGGMDLTEQHFSEFTHGNFEENTIHEHQCGYHTQFVANWFGMKIPTTVSTACSSALNAVILGAQMIQSGMTKRVIVGGTECLTRYHFNGFRSLHILDEQPCRPFDAKRAGINLGEGAAYLVLESADIVKRRKAHPIAWLTGMGNACDAFHQTASSENGQGAYLAMKEALKTAGLKSNQISYLNAHGTGTPNNDQSESVAINRVFNKQQPLISSTKGFTGHTTAASGTIESVICLLAMQNNFVPVNLNWKNQMPDGITPVASMKQEKTITLQHIMCNAFGFGGNDSSVIFSQAPISPEQTQGISKKIIYVHKASQISAYSLFDQSVDTTKYISAGEARRMSLIQKNALATALDALGDNKADAIIVGTALGCISDTEKFLTQINDNDEEMLSPTLFMQSTHNTIGSLIAMCTASHCYNNTYSSSESSIDSIMIDTLSQFDLLKNKHKNILAGFYDDPTELDKQLLQNRYQKYSNINIQSSAVSILFSNKPSVCALTDYVGMVPKDIVLDFVDSLYYDDDYILLGTNGNKIYDRLYQDIIDNISPQYLLHYKHLFGDGPSATAVGAYVSAQCILHKTIPTSLYFRKSQKKQSGNIIFVNFTNSDVATIMRFERCK